LTQPRFEDPHLFVVKAHELSLSGVALLELMRAVLSRNLSFRFCARGWSMAPFIHNGDVITVAPLQERIPGIGEVVAFIRSGSERLVVHRVVARRDKLVIFQGDNELGNPEESVPLENLLGKVTRIERNGHYVWIGLGPERYVIALLSKASLLTPLRTWLSFWLRPFSRRYK
jgi:signal peptidase I